MVMGTVSDRPITSHFECYTPEPRLVKQQSCKEETTLRRTSHTVKPKEAFACHICITSHVLHAYFQEQNDLFLYDYQEQNTHERKIFSSQKVLLNDVFRTLKV